MNVKVCAVCSRAYAAFDTGIYSFNSSGSIKASRIKSLRYQGMKTWRYQGIKIDLKKDQGVSIQRCVVARGHGLRAQLLDGTSLESAILRRYVLWYSGCDTVAWLSDLQLEPEISNGFSFLTLTSFSAMHWLQDAWLANIQSTCASMQAGNTAI